MPVPSACVSLVVGWGGGGGGGGGGRRHVVLFVVCVHRVSVQPDGMESLITLSEGDMRRALNILQVHTANPTSVL